MKLIPFLIFISIAECKLNLGKHFQRTSIVTVNESSSNIIVTVSSTTTTTTTASVNPNELSVFTFATPNNSTVPTLTPTTSSVPGFSVPSPSLPSNNTTPEVTTSSSPVTSATINPPSTFPTSTPSNSSIPTPPPNAPATILTPEPSQQNNNTFPRPQFSLTPPSDHEPQIISNRLLPNATQEIQINLTLADLSPSAANNKSIQINIQEPIAATARSTDAGSSVENTLEFQNTTVEVNNGTENPVTVIITFFKFIFMPSENGIDLFGSIEESTISQNANTEDFAAEESSVTSAPSEGQEAEMTTAVVENKTGITITKSNKTTIRREEVTSYDEEYKEYKS